MKRCLHCGKLIWPWQSRTTFKASQPPDEYWEVLDSIRIYYHDECAPSDNG